MQSEDIQAQIRSAIPDSQIVEVAVQGNHINLVVVSPSFAGLSVLKKQQMVYAALASQFADGSLHAVDFMKTYTPEEWRQLEQ
jgi:acid stress-induced BolA-like protein IbaG/YrbA